MSAPVAGVTPPGSGPAGGAAPPTAPQQGIPSFTLPHGSPEPGELPSLFDPTARPDEHVSTGINPLPAGPPVGAPVQTTASFLQGLASQAGAPAEIVTLAQLAQRSG